MEKDKSTKNEYTKRVINYYVFFHKDFSRFICNVKKKYMFLLHHMNE